MVVKSATFRYNTPKIMIKEGDTTVIRGIDTIRTGYALARDPYNELLNVQDQYGDFVEFDLATKRVFLLSDPEDIRLVLTTYSDDVLRDGRDIRIFRELYGDNLFGVIGGDQWMIHRAISQPAFHRTMIDGYMEVVSRQTREMFTDWERTALPDGTIHIDNLHQSLNNLAAGIIAEALFDYRINTQQAQELGGAISTVFQYYSDAVRGAGLPWILRNFAFSGYRKAQESITYLRAFAEDMLAHATPDRQNLLSSLIQAHRDNPEKFTRQEMIDEVVGFFVAGHETTANAAIWTINELHTQPEHVKTIRLQANEATGRPAVEQFRGMEMAKMCFKEAMRLHPPVWVFSRRATRQLELTKGRIVPIARTIVISPYIMHHDNRHWQNPEEFNPLRFIRNESQKAGTYIPFGMGPRSCIGAPLAMLEGPALVAMTLSRYDIALTNSPEPAVLAVMRPDKPVTATLTLQR